MRAIGAALVAMTMTVSGAFAADSVSKGALAPGKPAALSFPEDEDELEELEPDYIAFVAHDLAKSMLRAALVGGRPDPLKAILDRKIRLRGDLQRIVRLMGRHEGAGLEAIRSLPTHLLGD